MITLALSASRAQRTSVPSRRAVRLPATTTAAAIGQDEQRRQPRQPVGGWHTASSAPSVQGRHFT